MSESPAETLRRAAETLWPASESALPSGISAIVYDYLIECADAVERGSSPQGLAEAVEVLALAEQQQARAIDVRVYQARGIRDDSWLHSDRFTAFRHAYSYAAAKTHAIPGLSKISAEEAYYVWRIIQHGFEFNERTKDDPRLAVPAEEVK